MAYQPKSYRKFLAGAATAAVVASAIAPVGASAATTTVKSVSPLKSVTAYKGQSVKSVKLPTKVTVTYTNGKKASVAVKWSTLSTKTTGTKTLKGTIKGTSKKATLKVVVKADSIKSVAAQKAVTVKAGTTASLPKTVKVTYLSGKTANVAVTWGKVDTTKAAAAKTISGTVKGTSKKASIKVTVVRPLVKGNLATLVDSKHVKVAFDNGKTVTVTLAKELEDGATTVDFNYYGNDYKKVKLDKAYVADAVVKSVSAINAKELQITFSKALKKSSVIETSGTNAGTLVDGVFNVDGSAADALKGSLSADGKVLTITAATNWEGTHSVELVADKAVSAVGDVLFPQYATAFTYTDTTRASITGVEFVNKYTYTVKFSEPVASVGTVAAHYADGSTVTLNTGAAAYGLSADGKSFTVVVDPATLVNKEIIVDFPALTDFATTPNVSVPSYAKFTINNSDVTPPTVVSATAVSATTVKVKFSESINLLDETKFKFNGVALSNATVEADPSDDSVVWVTVPQTLTTGALTIDAQAVEDLYTNKNAAFSQIVNFANDKVAPTVNKAEVVKVAGVNTLKLTFSKEVSKVGTGSLSFKYVDTYGVLKTETVAASKVSVDTNDATIGYVTLNNGTANLAENVNYTVDIPQGYFEDGFKNASASKTVTFLNNASAVATSKLALIASNPIVTTDASGATTPATRADSGAFVDVQFADAVDPTTATTATNYTVEGAEVSKAVLVYNSPTTGNANGAKAVVRVYIKDNTIKASGNYNVTVKGVKGYSSAVSEMTQTTKNVYLTENIRPTVKSVAVKSFVAPSGDNGSTVVTVTFSEAIAADTVADGDFDLYVGGVKVTTATVTNGALGTSIDFTISKDLSADIAAGKEVKLVATAAFDLEDAAHNIANVSAIVIK